LKKNTDSLSGGGRTLQAFNVLPGVNGLTLTGMLINPGGVQHATSVRKRCEYWYSPILELSSSASSRMRHYGAFYTPWSQLRRSFSGSPIIPACSLLPWLQIVLVVFDDDFPIIYSKMQQVTKVMDYHVMAAGSGVADNQVS